MNRHSHAPPYEISLRERPFHAIDDHVDKLDITVSVVAALTDRNQMIKTGLFAIKDLAREIASVAPRLKSIH